MLRKEKENFIIFSKKEIMKGNATNMENSVLSRRRESRTSKRKSLERGKKMVLTNHAARGSENVRFVRRGVGETGGSGGGYTGVYKKDERTNQKKDALNGSSNRGTKNIKAQM